MTDQERSAAAVEHLSAAGAAHSVYEKNDLNGVYDQQWAEWYAQYLVDHGWNELFQEDWMVQDLTSALREADVAHRQNEPNARWSEYYAPRLLNGRE